MKIDDNLSKVFNIAEPVKETSSELVPSESPVQEEEKQDDYDLARSTLRNLLHKNEDVISSLVELAKSSEHPRAYEVAGQLIKTQSEIAKGLLDHHKLKKDIDGATENQNIKTQNNIVFAGPTSELMKMISAQKAKIIDAK